MLTGYQRSRLVACRDELGGPTEALDGLEVPPGGVRSCIEQARAALEEADRWIEHAMREDDMQRESKR